MSQPALSVQPCVTNCLRKYEVLYIGMKYLRLICRHRLRHIILSTIVSKTFHLIRSVTFTFTQKLHEGEWYIRFDFSHMERLCDGFNFTDQQDSQCTYNVTLRRVRAPIVAVEKQ